MKTIGMLGGMSWESTLEYYRIINEEVKKRLGETHSAKCIIYSFDFHEIEKLQHEEKWEEIEDLLAQGAENIINGGASFICICTNTMHLLARKLEQRISIPLIHIADTAGEAISKEGLKTVGLIGTKFTMEKNFYKKRIQDRFGIDVLIPNEQDRNSIHSIIYNELILGKIRKESREQVNKIIQKLKKEGAQGVILGCTEIGMLLNQKDTDIRLLDTALIHAEKAVECALQ